MPQCIKTNAYKLPKNGAVEAIDAWKYPNNGAVQLKAELYSRPQMYRHSQATVRQRGMAEPSL
jgi:hypothetical protein